MLGSIDNYDKKYLLDMLAYLLLDENAMHERCLVNFERAKNIYRVILQELKDQVKLKEETHNENFSDIDGVCFDWGTMCYLEKRLKFIEEALATRLMCKG